MKILKLTEIFDIVVEFPLCSSKFESGHLQIFSHRNHDKGSKATAGNKQTIETETSQNNTHYEQIHADSNHS